jgi:hypothetical protein
MEDLFITTAKLADSAVTTVKIADANVTTAKLVDASVTSAKIATDAVTATQIAANAVGTSEIADANVTAAKLASGAAASNLGSYVSSVDGSTGAITLANLSAFTKSLSGNGYQKLPGGLIIQWGTTPSGSVNGSATFPIAFPSACASVVMSMFTSNQVNVSSEVQSKSTTGFSYWIYNGTAGTYIAIGY